MLTPTPDLTTNFKLITCNGQLAYLKDFFYRNKEFVWDFETNIADFYDRRIRTMSFGNLEEQYIVDLLPFAENGDLVSTQGNYAPSLCFTELIDTVRPALDSQKHVKVTYNGEFEYITAKWCLGIWSWHFYCGHLAQQLIDCGRVPFKNKENYYGLDSQLKKYFGIELNKEHQKSFDLKSPLTPEQLTYCALDVKLPQALKQAQIELLVKHKLVRVAKIEFDTIPAMGDMHLNGIGFDPVEWAKRIEDIRVEKIQRLADLDKQFLPIVGGKDLPEVDLEGLEKQWKDTVVDKIHRRTLSNEDKIAYDVEIRDLKAKRRKIYQERNSFITAMKKKIADCEGEALINYDSHMQLKAALIKIGVPAEELPDTNVRTLDRLTRFPAVKALQAFRLIRKQDTTYGEPFLKFIHPKTGRIHSSFFQIGAETGRMSSTKPNLFNLPQEQKWRDGFISEDGWVLIASDFSGQEARIAAEKSKDPVWLGAFRKGWDVHSVVAELIFGSQWAEGKLEDCAYYFADHKKCSCPTHKKLRNQVKAINFGIIFGMTEYKLADELDITKKQAKTLLDKYKAAVPVLIGCLNEMAMFTKLNLMAVTMAGRIRFFKAPNREYAKALLIKDGVEQPDGDDIDRKVRGMWGSIEREGKNTPIQGTGADMLKLSLGCGFDKDGKPYLWHELRRTGAKLVNAVYDEVVVECRKEDAEHIAPIIKDRMIVAAGEFVKSIPFDSEQGISTRWQK